MQMSHPAITQVHSCRGFDQWSTAAQKAAAGSVQQSEAPDFYCQLSVLMCKCAVAAGASEGAKHAESPGAQGNPILPAQTASTQL